MNKLYKIFVKYSVLEDTEDYYCILTGYSNGRNGKKTKSTIGTILFSKYANKKIRKEYFKLLEYMFSPKFLNIRNNTMHINRESFDYFAIQFVSTMYQLLWDICKKDIFKMEEIKLSFDVIN